MSIKTCKFQQIEHTADVGLKIFGASQKELFQNAAEGLFSIITNLSKVRNSVTRELSLTSTDTEALLVDWLSELNFLFLTDRIVFNEFKVHELNDTSMSASICGEPLNFSRHEIYTEVKAVTYHALYIKRIQTTFEAQVIFDL